MASTQTSSDHDKNLYERKENAYEIPSPEMQEVCVQKEKENMNLEALLSSVLDEFEYLDTSLQNFKLICPEAYEFFVCLYEKDTFEHVGQIESSLVNIFGYRAPKSLYEILCEEEKQIIFRFNSVAEEVKNVTNILQQMKIKHSDAYSVFKYIHSKQLSLGKSNSKRSYDFFPS